MAHKALGAKAAGTGRREIARLRLERRLERFKRSGLSQARFCSRSGLPLSTLFTDDREISADSGWLYPKAS